MTSIRTILVTGANQGLGRHTVHQLAASPNVLVFMSARKISSAEDALAEFKSDVHASSSVVPIQLDITDEASIKNAHTSIKDHLTAKNLEGLDVLVNNAGILTPDFADVFKVNVVGTATLTAAIRPLLNDGGAIVNISSHLGSISLYTQHELPIYPAYASSKAALNSLTVQWALQEKQAGSGIRVVAVCPGFTKTALTHGVGEVGPEEACKVIVKTVLEKEGKTAVYFDKDREVPW